MVEATRTVGEITTVETRYYISSLLSDAKLFGSAVRSHWGIENSLHWQLDVTFGEDDNRVTQRNSAENLAALRRLAVSLLKRHPAKLSIARKRKTAALNPDFLQEIVIGAAEIEKI